MLGPPSQEPPTINMKRPRPATSDEIDEALHTLSKWSYVAGQLNRDYVFQDFEQAMAFMQRVAAHAQRLDHHPEWTNIYKRVQVRLITHDARAVTSLDFDLANAMDGVAEELLS